MSLLEEICLVAFSCRRRRLLPSAHRGIPDLAIAGRTFGWIAGRCRGARGPGASLFGETPLKAPEASAKTREEKRFSRYDKDKDGKVEQAEYLAARRRNFDRLDLDHNAALSFQEYAAKGIEKFNAAGGRKGWLSPAEFVATAPPAKRKSTCSCGVKPPDVADNSEDNAN